MTEDQRLALRCRAAVDGILFDLRDRIGTKLGDAWHGLPADVRLEIENAWQLRIVKALQSEQPLTVEERATLKRWDASQDLLDVVSRLIYNALPDTRQKGCLRSEYADGHGSLSGCSSTLEDLVKAAQAFRSATGISPRIVWRRIPLVEQAVDQPIQGP